MKAQPGSDWSSSEFVQHSASQERWALEIQARLGLKGSENIIDLGCGDGRLTAALASRMPGGKFVGVDASRTMIDFAQRSHESVPNLRFVMGDPWGFTAGMLADCIVSNTGLHWVERQEAVLKRCRLHLRRGGKLYFQMGGRGNAQALLEVAREVVDKERWIKRLGGYKLPLQFPVPEEYQSWLIRNGFRSHRCELISREMDYRDGEQLLGWLRGTCLPLAEAAGSDGEELLREIRDAHLKAQPGSIHLSLVRLEVEAEAV